MKLALPLTATNEFSAHYGAAAKFVVYEVDELRRTVNRRMLVVPQGSGPCAWPTLLRAAGVELVLAGGMGAGARAHMAEHGLEVRTGVPDAPPETLVEAWLDGRLVAGANACEGGDHGGHGRYAGAAAAAGRCTCGS